LAVAAKLAEPERFGMAVASLTGNGARATEINGISDVSVAARAVDHAISRTMKQGLDQSLERR
jgi:hypothetical protein